MPEHHCGLNTVALEGVTVRRGKQILLEDVNLELHCGEITAVIGANGAGKTTLLRCILGDIPYTGKVRFSDHHGGEAKRIQIGYVPQKLHFDAASPVSVADLFAATNRRLPAFFGSRMKDADRLASLRQAGCEKLLNRRMGELSGGELQRTMLALALDPMPDLLILDEPVSGVDAGGLEQFYQTVDRLRRDHHMAIILVSHDLRLVKKYADKVALIGGGVMAVGAPVMVYTSDAFRQTFGRGGMER